MIVDVAVLGAGPAGCAAAAMLTADGARVVLLDRLGGPAAIRGEILSANLGPSLSALGLSEAFAARNDRRCPGRLIAWSDAAPLDVPALYDPHGEAWTLDRTDFDAWLRAQLVDRGTPLLRAPTWTAARGTAGWRLTGSGHMLHAGLIVQASGRSPGIIGDPTRERPAGDDAAALIAHVTTASSDPRLLLERTAGGWLYSAGLARGVAVVALVAPASSFPAGRAARAAWWRGALARTRLLRSFLRAPTLELRCRPAHGSLRTELAGNAWCCIGEAAASYDPITGHGVAAAMAKGIALARLLRTSPPHRAFAAYAEAERSAFAAYTQTRRRWFAV